MTTSLDQPVQDALEAPDVVAQVRAVAERAKIASRTLATATRATKDVALRAMADALVDATPQIVEANAIDLERGRANGTSAGLLDRLALTPERIVAIADALRELAALPDPVGEVVRGSTLPNGLRMRQVRVPMGVVGMIYEARPNVTVDAAGLALKSGNAVILRGGSAAASSNHALVEAMRGSLAAQGLPADAVTLLESGGHDAARPRRPRHPTWGSRPHPDRRPRVHRPRHRDRRRGVSRLRRPRGRPRQGAGDHPQRQDPAAQRLQRCRVAARP